MYTVLNLAMLQVRENAISLRRWSGRTVHLRTLQGKVAVTLLLRCGIRELLE